MSATDALKQMRDQPYLRLRREALVGALPELILLTDAADQMLSDLVAEKSDRWTTQDVADYSHDLFEALAALEAKLGAVEGAE